ncbi:MAG: hypothetical protein ABI193_15555 [Minicystis sp.]
MTLAAPSSVRLEIFIGGAGLCTAATNSADAEIELRVPDCNTSAPFTGCFRPESVIAAAGTGVWEMDIADNFSSDAGTLQSWAVVLCSTP